MGESIQPLSLLHAWHGVGWITLRFSESSAPGNAGKRLEFTIWKSCVAHDAWRWLCIQVVSERGEAGPGRAEPGSAA